MEDFVLEVVYLKGKQGLHFEKSALRTKIMNTRCLTSECWSIQFWGLPYCRECDYLATEDCGGYGVRKRILSGKYPSDGLPDLSTEPDSRGDTHRR